MNTIRNAQKQTWILIGVFGLIGAALLANSFAQTPNKQFEAESAAGAYEQSDPGASGQKYVQLGRASSVNNVPIPSNPGTSSLFSRPGYYMGNRVNCSSKESVCAFGWQEGDVYSEPRHQRYGAKVEWRNILTNEIIKTVNLPDLPNAPINGARVYPIYNSDNDNWFVVYHASRKGGASGDNQTSIYGALFDASGNVVGSVIEVYDGSFSGWVPHGYYDHSAGMFYMEWHQQTSSLNGRKDITAALVDGVSGLLVKSGLKVHDTPDLLEEYSGSAYNPINREGLTLTTRNTGACDEGCLTRVSAERHSHSAAGLVSAGPAVEIDNDTSTFEWYISLGFNVATRRYLAVYGQSNVPYREGPQIQIKAKILDINGNPLSGELDLGPASVGGFYWQTGTACSTRNNLCLVSIKDKALYVDTAKTDSQAIGPAFAIQLGGGTSKTAYQPTVNQFVIFGQDGYVTVRGE